jgi:hypothetical protein
MHDPANDTANATNEKDVVGDAAHPAGLRAADAQNLYLRLQLAGDPAPAAALKSSSWGMAFDLDNDRRTYELLVLVDGIGGAASVVVLTNRTTTMLDLPTDPADLPAAATLPFANNGRSIASVNGDFYLDFAVPWSTLAPLGLDRDTPTHVWAASSTQHDRLDLDFACHDGRTGSVTLSGTASDPTTGDPTRDPANVTGGERLEGGGGCNTGRGAELGFVLAAAFGLTLRRRR